MVSPNVDKILQQARSLNLAEREEFIELLKNQPVPSEPLSEEEKLAAEVLKKGIILTIPPKPTPEEIARFNAWKPIQMPGPSLSDELIRDRR
jgi:hypothetical protein